MSERGRGRGMRGRRYVPRGGPRRGPPRGPLRGPPRSDYGGRPMQRDFPENEELESRELDFETKKIIIEVKSNEQGKFMKLIEQKNRVIFSIETGVTFRKYVDEFTAAYNDLGPPSEVPSSEKLMSKRFEQGHRTYFVDLRHNHRGRYLKVTLSAGGNKQFVAIPGEGLEQFKDAIGSLMDKHGPTDLSPPASPGNDSLPNAREVRAGGKTFFFDVERNDRGAFVRLSEVLRVSGRRKHINIPNSCWSQMSEVFSQLSVEMPYEAGSASPSGSEDN